MGTKFKGDLMRKKWFVLFLCCLFCLCGMQKFKKREDGTNYIVYSRKKIVVPGMTAEAYPGFVHTPGGIFYCLVFSTECEIPPFSVAGKNFDAYPVAELEGAFSSFIDVVVDQYSFSRFSFQVPVQVFIGTVDVSREERIRGYFLDLQSKLRSK
jgi:hypothetical protein